MICRNIVLMPVIWMVFSFTVIAADLTAEDVKKADKALQPGADADVSEVITQSQKSRENLKFNTYITGESKDLKIEVDLYSSRFFNDYRYMLVPIRIVNKSAKEISLDSSRDRIFLIFRRQTGYVPYLLEYKNFPGSILPGKDILFAGRYGFQSYDERLGVEISLKFLKMIVEGLNPGGAKLKKNELSNMEKQMQFNSSGKFESGTLGTTIKLEYKIIKK